MINMIPKRLRNLKAFELKRLLFVPIFWDMGRKCTNNTPA
jgi:hypothetical protein